MSDPTFAGMSDEDFEQFLSGDVPSAEVEEEQVSPAPDSAVEEIAIVEESEITPDKVTVDEPAPTEDTVATQEAGDTDALAALYAPINFQGTDIEIKSIEEARQLMQMGVINSKFVDTHKQTIATLQEHKIDANKLNHLIDVLEGKPEAIAKLVREHNIDTYALETDTEYTPTNHSVSPTKLALNDVLDEIQSTPSFTRTTAIVTEEWDVDSRTAVLNNPEYLRELNNHVKDGTYDKIMQEVTRIKVFGGMKGMSNLQAYAAVGKQLQESGALNTPAPVVVARQPKSVDTTNVDKKRGASPSRGTPANTTPKGPVDVRGMSDDEFEKLLNVR